MYDPLSAGTWASTHERCACLYFWGVGGCRTQAGKGAPVFAWFPETLNPKPETETLNPKPKPGLTVQPRVYRHMLGRMGDEAVWADRISLPKPL